MGYFKEKNDALMASGKTSEDKIREVIAMLDNCVFTPMEYTEKKKFWDIMRKMHEIYHGCHYDEAFAVYEVDQMFHTNKAGIIHRGQHWTLQQVEEVFASNRRLFKNNDNVYDLYVALHSWWHDNICEDIVDFGSEKAESMNIKRAMHYFFGDEDAPEGKIWHYYKCMRK